MMRLKNMLAAMVVAVVSAGAAHAAVFKPFTDAAFTAARQGGGPVVVEVYAPWCPVCARQQPILSALEANPEYARVTVLRVDFDTQKSVLRALKVQMQSTLIGFRGDTETARSSGVVQKPAIEALFASTLKG